MPAIIRVVDGRTVIKVGENTAMAAAAASLAEQFANAAALAAAAVGVYGTTAEGIGATTNGQSFYVTDGTDFALYENNAGVADLVISLPTATDVNARVPYAELASTAPGEGAALVGTASGGNVQTDAFDSLPTNGSGSAKSLIGAYHNLPATTPGGDDAPNTIIGSFGAVDLPSNTYGNIVQGPRDNNVTGGAGYRNRLGGLTSLSVIFGGDNDLNALATFNIGHHNRADTTGGGAPSHPMMIGSYQTVTSAYGVAIGTVSSVHATKAVIIGSDSSIGTEGDGNIGRASGIVGGGLNAITGRNSFIGGGNSITISGEYSAAFGRLTKASHNYTFATGYAGTTIDHGERVHSPGPFNAAAGTGDNLDSRLNLFREFTSALATQLLTDGTAASVNALGVNTSHFIEGIVHAVRVDGGANQEAAYRIEALISNMSGTTTILYQNVTTLYEDNAGWNVSIILSGGTYSVRVYTADASATVRAAARLNRSVIRNI